MWTSETTTIANGDTVSVDVIRGTVWGVADVGIYSVTHAPSGRALARTNCRNVAIMGALLAAWASPNEPAPSPVREDEFMARWPHLFAVRFAVDHGGISTTGDTGFDAACEMLANISGANAFGCGCCDDR